MLRARREHDKTQPRQQVVHPREFVRNAELLFEDADDVCAAERADTVLFGRPVEHALSERFVLFGRQRGRLAGLFDWSDGLESVVAVGVAPSLHEAS